THAERESGFEEIELRPPVLRAGDHVQIAFRAARIGGSMRVPRYRVAILDERRRPIANLLRGPARPAGGAVCVEWDGRDDRGLSVLPGIYCIHIQLPGASLPIERKLFIDS